MRENRTSGSEGGEAQTNELSLPLSLGMSQDGEVYEPPPRVRKFQILKRCFKAKQQSRHAGTA